MASLRIRKLDDSIYELLRVRATKHGVSMEEEARQIICQAVKTPDKLSEVFRKYFGHGNGVNLDIPDRGLDSIKPFEL